MSINTKKLTLHGMFWNAIDRFGNQIVITLVGIVNARLLDVEDFAVMAALGVFMTVATALTDSGFATSLVRSKHVTEEDYSSMFVFNLIVSCTIYAILYIAAPYIEAYFAINGLTWYARVLFLQLIIHAFGIVQYVKVLRNMQFNITARVNVLSVFLSGSITILLLYLGFGVWVLIWQPLLYSIFRTFLFWYWGDWKLNFVTSKASLRTHLDFSIAFMIANLLGKVLSPLYNSFVSRNYTKVQTGYYYQANKWGETPNLLISSIIQGTTLSTLTPIQDDYPRFLNACRKTMSTLSFVLFPVSFLAISVAQPGFILALTDKYSDAVINFQLLCLAGLFISLTDMNVNFINIKGKSRLSLQLEVLKIGLALGILYLTYDKGVLAIILGQIVVRFVCYIVVTFFSKDVYGYNLLMQLKDLAPPLFISVLAALAAYSALYFSIVDSNLLMVIIQSAIFVVIYLTLNHMIKNDIWMEILQLIKSKLIKKSI